MSEPPDLGRKWSCLLDLTFLLNLVLEPLLLSLLDDESTGVKALL